MKVAWATAYDARDRNGYGSSRGSYEATSLEKQSVSLEYLGPLQIPRRYKPIFYVKSHLVDNRFISPVNKRWYSRERAPFLVKNYARQISRKLAAIKDVDIVCSGPHASSQPVAYLECDQPIVIWNDGLFADVLDFYPGYARNRICRESIEDGIANERAAVAGAKLLIYASEWAAQGAIKHYQVDPSKIRIVPWGANFECRNSLDSIREIVSSRPTDRCKLLFFGFDWERKRGGLALEVAKALNQSGLNTELTAVTIPPEQDEPFPSYVRFLTIDKSTEEGLSQLFKVLSESHFMILPTTADASPYALPEACAFGLPCLTSDVGGIPTMIRDNVNGKTFSVNAGINEYCTYISNLFSNYSRYKNLALSTFHEYETRLNWSVAGKTVKKLLEELIS